MHCVRVVAGCVFNAWFGRMLLQCVLLQCGQQNNQNSHMSASESPSDRPRFPSEDLQTLREELAIRLVESNGSKSGIFPVE